MSAPFVFKGLLVGLSIAAPVGPIGVLCIRRSIADGPRIGFVCGLGAAVADTVYALIGGFALSTVSPWLTRGRLPLTAAGGAFLLYLGLRTFMSKPAVDGPVASAKATAADDLRAGAADHLATVATDHFRAGAAFLSTFLLTLANPTTILSFAAVFAGAGVVVSSGAAGTHYGDTAALVAGVFAGSAAWWLFLSSMAGRFRGHIGPRAMTTINRACGVFLAAFGLYSVTALL